jgi:hypothetical protein
MYLQEGANAIHQLENPPIADLVIYALAFFPVGDQPRLPEDIQVL